MSDKSPIVVVGDFYPFHRGHAYLIEVVKKMTDQLIILILEKPNDAVPGVERAAWIFQSVPDVTVKIAEAKVVGADPDEWLTYVMDVLGVIPGFVLRSDLYDPKFMSILGGDLILAENLAQFCGDREIRHSPIKYWECLMPAARQHFARRVTIVGAQGTGKSTLAKALAEKLRTVWVPDYGQAYREGKSVSGDAALNSDEFTHIAVVHHEMTEQLASSSNRYLIRDTDAWITRLCHKLQTGRETHAFDDLVECQIPDLYILTAPDLPTNQKGGHDSDGARFWMHQTIRQELVERGLPFVEVFGPLERRVAKSIMAIENL